MEQQLQKVGIEASKRLAGMNEAQKLELARWFAGKIIGEISYAKRIESQLSPWDALWLFLAVGTAWKICRGTD